LEAPQLLRHLPIVQDDVLHGVAGDRGGILGHRGAVAPDCLVLSGDVRGKRVDEIVGRLRLRDGAPGPLTFDQQREHQRGAEQQRHAHQHGRLPDELGAADPRDRQ
jgi:hypothetical protein